MAKLLEVWIVKSGAKRRRAQQGPVMVGGQRRNLAGAAARRRRQRVGHEEYDEDFGGGENFGDESGHEEGYYLDDLDLPERKIGKKSWQSCR